MLRCKEHIFVFKVYPSDNDQSPHCWGSLSKAFFSLVKGINSTPQAQKRDLGPRTGHTLYSWKAHTPREASNSLQGATGSFSEKDPRRPCNVLSCLEKAVWTFSQLTPGEAYYVFQSCCPKPSRPASCPASGTHTASGADSVPDKRGSRLAGGLLPAPAARALPGRWRCHSAPTGPREPSSQLPGFPQTLLPRSGEVLEHTCCFSAWMLSLPFVTFFSPVTIFISAQWPFLWEVALIRSNPIILGSDGPSRIFYERLRRLQISHLPLRAP